MYPSLNTPEFQTECLNVFRIDIKANDLMRTRAVFMGFYRDEEVVWPIVSATVDIDGPFLGHTMDKIETHADDQSEGLAEELWQGIEDYLGRAVVTEESESTDIALSVAQARKQIGRTTPDLNDPVVQEQIKQAYLMRHNRMASHSS